MRKTAMRAVLTLGILASLLAAGRANATLIDRGAGLIYDDTLNITWVQDANLCLTLGNCVNGNAVGFMKWADASTWASNLAFGGYDDWRLPYISVAAGAGPVSGPAVICATAGEVACRDNEFGYMYFYNLTPPGDPGGSPTQVGTNLMGNHGPFNNIRGVYWSGTAASTSTTAWVFSFNSGGSSSNGVTSSFAAWAVRSGDSVPATVPEPGSLALLGTGLAGLGGLAWRRRQRR